MNIHFCVYNLWTLYKFVIVTNCWFLWSVQSDKFLNKDLRISHCFVDNIGKLRQMTITRYWNAATRGVVSCKYLYVRFCVVQRTTWALFRHQNITDVYFGPRFSRTLYSFVRCQSRQQYCFVVVNVLRGLTVIATSFKHRQAPLVLSN